MASEDKQIDLLTEEDAFRALRNYYMEQYAGAVVAVRHFEHRQKEPRNGDDITKLKADLQKAKEKIADTKLMISFIDAEIKKL